LQYSRYYFGTSYEKDVPASGSTTERLYVGGSAYNAPAVYIRTGSGAWTLHYIHRDHLGSITAITNSSGSKIAEYSYDPWGRQRNPANQQAYGPDEAPSLLLGRGYTGHEHLPMFGLINMNARLYDPVLGRFLSPDPYVQAPDFSQSFNRYSYCLNNPLIYVDENGEFILSFLTGFFKGLFSGGAPFKQGWKSVVNEAKIIGGLFTSDKNKSFWGQVWEIVSRFTWQAPQTTLGSSFSLVSNIFTLVDKVDYYGGATVVTFYGDWGAVTMGSFINGDNDLEADPDNALFQHEYGHYLQSQASGPFYLQRYGIPSLFSSGNHSLHPVEQDANKRALKYFSKREGEGNFTWNQDYNPITGYNWDESYDSDTNRKILRDTMGISWYDWCLSTNLIVPGLINTLWLNRNQ
jgi:RHS repeat-associated protein